MVQYVLNVNQLIYIIGQYHNHYVKNVKIIHILIVLQKIVNIIHQYMYMVVKIDY